MTRLAAAFAALLGAACSARTLAVRSMTDAVARADAVWGRDDDPELVRDASPFSLKTIESLLEDAPGHRGLLQAATSGFTQYAYAFVQQEADFAEAHDPARARALRARARRLYVRARDYGLRELDADFPAFRERLSREPRALLAGSRARHVPALYWTALAWGGAMSVARDDAELAADQAAVESMMRRALALDEGFRQGALHDFFMAWEASGSGGSIVSARGHFERSLALARGRRAAPLVIYAETVCVARQDRAEFDRRLREALAIDADRTGGTRLENLIVQARARWLLARGDELFLE